MVQQVVDIQVSVWYNVYMMIKECTNEYVL